MCCYAADTIPPHTLQYISHLEGDVRCVPLIMPIWWQYDDCCAPQTAPSCGVAVANARAREAAVE